MNSISGLYKGKKRLAKKRLPVWSRRILQWALTIKSGDYIGTCEGCNRKVAEIELIYVNEGEFYRCKPNKTRLLHEIEFTDTRGQLHFCPGGGCAFPKETNEQITRLWSEWAFDEKEKREERIRHWYGKDTKRIENLITYWQKLNKALQAGHPILDKHGELLPDFDSNPYA